MSDAPENQPRTLPLNITKDLCGGKTYIVTGANVGLGLEAARHLVAIGAAKVIMAVRNLDAGAAASADIEASTGVKGVAEVWQLDLSSSASVKAFASKAATLKRIDAVIENAAVAAAKDPAKIEGHHPQLTVNVVNTFLLAVLLLPKLRADAAAFGYAPRVSFVTSATAFDMAEFWAAVADDPIKKMDDMDDAGLKLYPASKLMEIFAVRELARLLPLARGGVVMNVLNPGLCETTLSRNAPQGFKDQLKQMWAQAGRTAECGSRTLLASAVAGDETHGCYMSDCVLAEVPSWMDAKAAESAWRSIAGELDKIEPGCVEKALK